MTSHRASELSLTSDLAEELDSIQIRDDYELGTIDGTSHEPPTTIPDPGDQEEEQLLNPQVKQDAIHLGLNTPSKLRAPITRSQDNLVTKVKQTLRTYNPTTLSGRQQISKDIRRSGTVTRAHTELVRISEKWQLEGWRFGVFLSIIAVTLCFVVELVLLICAIVLNKSQGDKHGIGVIYVGECRKVEYLSNILAVPLNIIATVLVATSNYVMQCLSAPSRKDVDKAHSAGSYLDIGIPSVHNLLHNPSWRAVLWLILAITTIPIHLLLNSAFFGALQANNYGVMVVSEDWRTWTDGEGGDFGSMVENDGELDFNGTLNFPLTSTLSLDIWNDIPALERLSSDECFRRYASQLQSRASNVVLVTKKSPKKYSLLPELKQTDLTVDSNPVFNVPEGVTIYVNPFSGNAVPILNASQHWTHGIVPQNASGGLYFLSSADEYLYLPPLQGMFSSFDYHYWMTVNQLDYDFNNSDIIKAGQWNPTSWMCDPNGVLQGSKSCTSGNPQKAPTPWRVTPANFEVDHCLSQKTKEKCSLEYSFIILIVVIACDVTKIAAMSAALWRVSERPLTTLGDAIASFLENPDDNTRGCCLMDQEQARRVSQKGPWRLKVWKWKTQAYQHANQTFAERLEPSAYLWKHQLRRWWSVPSKSRWIAFAFLYTALFTASITVLVLGVQDLANKGINNPLNQGFGSINPNAVFTYPAIFSSIGGNNGSTYTVIQTNKSQTLFADVLTVNTPQLLFSMLYFMYNGLFTSMVTSAEWTQFAKVRKALRVSTPKKGQRSTYWLQLPWKFSLPLLVTSILLHWLVSRSLFIVRVNVFGWDGAQQPDRNISACGYSPLAIVIVILLVVLSLIVMIAAGWLKLTSGIPICGTNSVAIAAACHSSSDGDPLISQKKLLWGVVDAEVKEGVGHCSMSDGDVGELIDGMRYE